jgi:hypothetical protein
VDAIFSSDCPSFTALEYYWPYDMAYADDVAMTGRSVGVLNEVVANSGCIYWVGN